MKTNKITFITLAIAAAAMLTACQGQNPFKAQRNPAPESRYPHVNDPQNMNAYKAGTKLAPLPSNVPTPPPPPPEDAPTVKFEGLKEKVVFGEGFDFKIVIEDKTANGNNLPEPQQIKIKGEEKTDTKTAKIVDCMTLGKRTKEHVFEFNCHFDSNLVKNADKIIAEKREQEVEVEFSLTAVSTASRQISKPARAVVKVKFEKVETKGKPVVTEPPAQEEPQQPAPQTKTQTKAPVKGAKS